MAAGFHAAAPEGRLAALTAEGGTAVLPVVDFELEKLAGGDMLRLEDEFTGLLTISVVGESGFLRGRPLPLLSFWSGGYKKIS